ncbi:MAG TPA: hypothetical protein PKV80_24375, partial [Leptospiraceae bacterium]|nr:hypothetical protein [Leptospiraceae bacterium]
MRLTMIICLLLLCFCRNENKNRNLAALLLKKGGGVCGAPSNSLDLFLYQMTQVPGPSTGNPPWNTSYCRPNTSVTTASSFAEQTFVSEAISAMGNFAMAISGLNSSSYIDGTGISFNTLSSGTGRPSGVSAISSEWFYDASGTYIKKIRRGVKTISGGTSYLPLASNLTESNPVTGCPSNPSSTASPIIVDVVETTSYDYSDIMNVKEDLSYTCSGVQAKGPGFIQRKIYSLDSLLRIKSIVVYVDGDFSVKT